MTHLSSNRQGMYDCREGEGVKDGGIDEKMLNSGFYCSKNLVSLSFISTKKIMFPFHWYLIPCIKVYEVSLIVMYLPTVDESMIW